ncbi:hypothetical protein GCM10009106_26080 [Sphingomonas japonica]
MREPDAGRLVERALVRAAAQAGIVLDVITADAEPWASVTFSGARHTLRVETASGERIARWLDALPDLDLPVAGHLIADAVVVTRHDDGVRVEAELELLSVADR